MVKWYDRIGNTIEMLVGKGWIKGIIVNGERTGDGIINMETADGKKYWCGVCSGFYMKTSDSLGDLITQADVIRNMTDEELAEFLDHGILDVCESFKCEECENRMNCDVCYLEWLKSEVKE